MIAPRASVGVEYDETGDGDAINMPGIEVVMTSAIPEKVVRPAAEHPTGIRTVTVTVAATIGTKQCTPAINPNRLAAFIVTYE